MARLAKVWSQRGDGRNIEGVNLEFDAPTGLERVASLVADAYRAYVEARGCRESLQGRRITVQGPVAVLSPFVGVPDARMRQDGFRYWSLAFYVVQLTPTRYAFPDVGDDNAHIKEYHPVIHLPAEKKLEMLLCHEGKAI